MSALMRHTLHTFLLHCAVNECKALGKVSDKVLPRHILYMHLAVLELIGVGWLQPISHLHGYKSPPVVSYLM